MADQNWKLDGEKVKATASSVITWENNNQFFTVHAKGKNFRGEIIHEDLENKKLIVKINHREFEITKEGPLDALIAELGLDKVKVKRLHQLKSPMPGRVVSIAVNVGDEIEVGAPLLTLEAMKMENVLKSEGVGIVKSIETAPNDVVDKGAVLITFE